MRSASRARHRPEARADGPDGRWVRLAVLALLLVPAAADGGPAHGGGEGLFEVQSALGPPAGSLAVSFGGFAYSLEARRDPGGAGRRDVLDGGLQLSLGVGGWAQAFARLDGAAFDNDDAGRAGLRDGLLGAKIVLPPPSRWFNAGIAATLTLPWGDRERGFSTGGLDPGAALLVTFLLPEPNPTSVVRLHGNVGYRWRRDDRGRGYDGEPPWYLEPVYPDEGKDRIDLRGALELRASRITLFAELLADHLPDSGVSWSEGPIFLTPGLRLQLARRLSFTLASKVSLAVDDPATTGTRPPEELYPDWQLGFALTWSRFAEEDADYDGDGVPDFRDHCPRAPEDADGCADGDGCPEADCDGDGVPDELDLCPGKPAGERDADRDGCPDPPPVEEDADGDGSEPPASPGG